MKKTILFAASALLTLASCTTSDEHFDGIDFAQEAAQENAIQFGTYLGQQVQTRTIGGGTGAIDNAKLKTDGYGFGVFAFYTGTQNYGGDGSATAFRESKKYPNFMYNEYIKWNGTKWDYNTPANTKYWPNEFSSTGVDDQENGSKSDPAQGPSPLVNGGKVTFFAYAPYVPTTFVDGTKANIDGQLSSADEGITALSGNAWIGQNAGGTPPPYLKYGDPYVSYVIPAGRNVVDLLWGTAGKNGQTAYLSDQEALTAGTWADSNEDENQDANNYHADILNGYKVNENLTKMTTTGTVDFAFKHALAKVGGSYNGTASDGSDDDPSTTTNGLMVVLDIDKDGNESGGSLQAYTGGSITANTKYNTKVTINEIKIDCSKQVSSAGKTAQGDGSYSVKTAAHTENLIKSGNLNLATGRWILGAVPGSETVNTHTIWPAGHDIGGSDTDDTHKDGVLNTNIAEPNGFSGTLKAGFESLPIGVTTVPKNVYESEANPFVFIPGTRPVMTVTVDYTVRTYDAKLAAEFTNVRQRITKTVSFGQDVELNKQYSLLIHLGLTSVKFSATVSDWDSKGTETGGSTDGVGGSAILTVDEDVEHVFVPMNVGVVASKGGTFQIPIVTIDGKTYLPSEYSSKSITFAEKTDKDYASVAAATGIVTFSENLSLADRDVTITATKGGKTQDIVVKQYAARDFSLAMTFGATTVSASGGTVAPTITATYLHSDGSEGSKEVTTAATNWQVNGSAGTFATPNLTIPAGTVNAAIKVSAQFTDNGTTKTVTVDDASKLKYN